MTGIFTHLPAPGDPAPTVLAELDGEVLLFERDGWTCSCTPTGRRRQGDLVCTHAVRAGQALPRAVAVQLVAALVKSGGGSSTITRSRDQLAR